MKKKFRRFLSSAVVLVMLLSFSVFAEDKAPDKNKIGEELKEMGLIKGDDKGNLNTDSKLTREQAVVVLARLLGKEEKAQNFEGKLSFEDVSYDYYKPFIAYAVEQKWITGRDKEGKVFGFKDEITSEEFSALALRGLGYTEYKGDKFKEVSVKAKELGLDKDLEVFGKNSISRGDAFVIIRNTLVSDVKDSKFNENLYETLVYKKYYDLKDSIVIAHTNDMHGFFIEGKYDGMGASKIKRFVDVIKSINNEAVYVDAGDAIQGANLVTLSKGDAAIDILNGLGLETVVMGNHEFDYGTEQLNKLYKKASFPMISSNVFDKNGKLLYKPYIIKEIKGKKIAFIGITTPETTYKSHPDNTKGLKFEEPVDIAKKMVKELKGKADIFVALAHLGDEVGEKDYTSIDLAKKVPELTLIIDGHSHSTYPEGKLVNGVMIVSAGEKTKNVGIVTINPENIKEVKATLFTKADSKLIKEDQEMLKIVNKIKEANEKIEKEEIKETPVELVGEREVVRKGQSTLGNLLTASLLDVSKADFAFTNGGGIRSTIEKGMVTKGDILKAFPFGNTVRVIELKGKDIKVALEHGFEKYPELNGGFPHVAGMTVKFDAKKEAGKRLVEVLDSKGKKLEDDKKYTLASNDFLVAGGDGYKMFTGKPVVAEFGSMDEILIKYVMEKGFDEAKITGWLVIEE